MKPVAIIQHAAIEGPGYCATFLDDRAIPMELFRTDESRLPAEPSRFSGIVIMGGPMSVNDDLPWIDPVLALIREAVRNDIPVLGHCLGGQLMAKALGGVVHANPVKEIGWGRVDVLRGPEAHHWFGAGLDHFLSFHWHGETFTLPDGAVRILESRHCSNQAFVLGKHLAMQCHVEMTADMIRTWAQHGAAEIAAAKAGSAKASVPVEDPQEMEQDIDRKVAELQTVAARLYGRWVKGLRA